MNIYEWIGFIAAVSTTTAFLPQVIKSVINKSTKDLSYIFLSLQASGCFLWMIYGMALSSLSLTIANLITFSLVLYLFILKIVHQ